MKLADSESFSLENFEGPLDLLWHLINRQEIDIYEISIKSITRQFIEKCRELPLFSLDRGAEFLGMASALVWFKSKTLLPKHEQVKEEESFDEENDPRFEIIHQLVDYCRFKQAAKMLSDRESSNCGYYFRGAEEGEVKKKLGIDHISVEDLAGLFRNLLAKASVHRGVIQEEEWRVSDKIAFIRVMLKENYKISFVDIFTLDKSREELIVLFLALLELMKGGEVKVVGQVEIGAIYIEKA